VYYSRVVTTISCRIPDALAAALADRARERRVSKTTLIREALGRAVRAGRAARAPRAYEVAQRLCGALHGPTDLSSNPRHLDDLGD
jgi:hypothetical protein